MIVKQRDATKSRITYLETCETPEMDSIHRQGLKQAAARLRADCTTGNACRQIDNYFAKSEDWLVLHDLRMRHASQIMQINHLLISKSLDFYIIDSRYLENALELNNSGRCWALTNKHRTPIASPLNKLNRDIRLLRDIIKNAAELPRFLGISPTIKVHGYILTNPALKSSKPLSSVFDSSSVITPDALFASVWEKRQGWMRSKGGNIASSTLRNLAQSLLSLHIPTVSPKLMDANITSYETLYAQTQDQVQDTSHCAQCSKPVTAYVREQSFRRMDIFHGQVLCVDCQSAAQDQPTDSVAL